MLEQFLTDNRDVIISRVRERVAVRSFPEPTDVEMANGIPVFLDQLGEALHFAGLSISVEHGEIARTASRHGNALFRMGLSVGQVVRDYGDVCQVITELAIEKKAQISAENFRTLNLSLDEAIAGAVTEHARLHDRRVAEESTERLGTLAHELRNHLNTAMLSFESIKTGRVAVGGSTGQVLSRSLLNLRALIDRSLAEVRLDAGIDRLENIRVSDLLDELAIGASLQAQYLGMVFVMTSVDRAVTIEGDRPVLTAAIFNLLQNAFKFTRPHTQVSLTTIVSADRVLFEVRDECGGLPPGKSEELFRPFEQRGDDRSGVGLGLSICMKAAKANGGTLRVRDLPGDGCVFILDLPRKVSPPLSLIAGGKVQATSG